MFKPSPSAGLAAGHDWQHSDLGPRAAWPHTLRVAVDILLAAPWPMLLVWGERNIPVYNAAYASLAGRGHPPAPGALAGAVLPAPLAADQDAYSSALAGHAQHVAHARLALAPGAASLACDLHLTPLHDEHGRVAGVLYALDADDGAPASAPATASGLRVLVVEDNLDSQYLVCEMLKAFGHAADGVAHAEGALALLAAHPYEVLFSDVSLPGMSGVELARQALREAPSLQVIFASGYGDALLRHVEFPFQSLQKPYEIDQLQAALAAIAGGAARSSGPSNV